LNETTATQRGVTSQAEEYLEAICRIAERGETASPTELARELAVAPPSVLGMLRRMEEQELLTYSRQTGAVLSAHGQACAERLRRRHRLAERLLTDLLGMPWARAHDVACRFEHVIDDEVESYLITALHNPTTCPHGNPLDGHTASGGTPLDMLSPGQSAILRCIMDESAPLLDYLLTLGLQPGIRVRLHSVAPFAGPLLVDIAGESYALSREVAARLLVDVEEAE
jgi:DtxR family Mn-dependent transcriptional regulator